MRRKLFFLGVAGTLLCLAGLLVLAGRGSVAGEPANPHAFMEDPAECAACHTGEPETGKDDFTTVAFTDQIVSLCSKCHEEEHFREEHPVEIKPDSEIPEEFHLDRFHTMTCATCHDPHGEFEAEERFVPPSFMELVSSLIRRQRRFPTYFLRKPNTRGELCLGCHRQGISIEGEEMFAAEILPQYVGSEACRECHPVIYREWKMTLHSRNYRDAVKEPSSIRARFDGDKPFPPGKVLFTVGEHWAQAYIVEGRRGLMVRPERWSITGGEWLEGGSFSRPWIRYCAGCHTTGLNPFEGSYVERGTGCEVCHGPGLHHTESTDQFDIVNPALLVKTRSDMICESCHTSGHDRGGKFRYPVGFRPGEDLMSYYRGLVPRAGQDVASFTGDGSYEDRHRQFEFWAGRVDVARGLTCDVCAGRSRPSSEEAPPEKRLTANEMCGTCHPAALGEYREHSGHSEEEAGCLDCHPPMVTGAGDAYSIHDHMYQFGKPPRWVVDGVDPCQRCHPGSPPEGKGMPASL